jgi:type VI secretion system protein ImpB
MSQEQGQNYIGRNRPPRVQIEYEVYIGGAEKKVQLSFVMADLAGKREGLPPVAERKFLEIDTDRFNDRLKALQPRVAFTVPNKLSGEGNLVIDLTFESMDDFAPDAVARKIEPLRKLLEAREQLSHLLSYMDGKDGAEALVERLLKDRPLQQKLLAAPKPTNVD